MHSFPGPVSMNLAVVPRTGAVLVLALTLQGCAEAADIRAGRAGIVCAREHSANEDLALCCEGRGF